MWLIGTLHLHQYSKKRKTISILAIFFGFLSILPCLFLFTTGYFDYAFDANPFDNAVFDKTLWDKDRDRAVGGSIRPAMAEDILNHRVSSQMSQSDIEKLLGEPQQLYTKEQVLKDVDMQKPLMKSPTHFEYNEHISASKWVRVKRFRREDIPAETVCAYYLGEDISPVHHIDTAFLMLYFDKNKRYVGGRLSVSVY